ncbi:MAG: S8 family serine peptidase [Eggerthellaceae bacterium]|nr:S8 family serine peptidase [Eggerthellaceae bacterium]MDR2715486.1 S8 family serine peptidase [Coriobacteriaceae bacterium]
MKKRVFGLLMACALVGGMLPLVQEAPYAEAAEDAAPSLASPHGDGTDGLLPGDGAESVRDGDDPAAWTDGDDPAALPGEAALDGPAAEGALPDVSPGPDEAAEPLAGDDLSALGAQVIAELEANPDAEYAEGEVIVVFHEDVSAAEASEILEEVDAVDEDSVSAEAMVSADTVVVEVSEDASLIEALVELNSNPEVAFAQPNYIYRLMDDEGLEGLADGLPVPDADPQDALLPLATSINDPSRGSQWALTTTRLFDAWSLTRANKTVAVAVIDTGIRADHEDLKNVIIPGSAYDATGRGQTSDSHGHGTHVAGIIAAEANNGRGIAGVSYNARIVPIRIGNWVIDSKGNRVYSMYTSEVCNAYDYLLANVGGGKTRAQSYNLKVINLSLGAYARDGQLEARINAAYNAGILTVCAAGNNKNNTAVYPGSFTRCINVSALKKGTGVLNDVFDASYSSFGSTIDLSAPGTNIYSTTNASASSYGYNSGTSMAAPYVAGAAALVFAANPSTTPAQVRTALEKTAQDLGAPGWDQYYGHGQVNPYAAAKYVAVTKITYATKNNAPITVGTTIDCKVTSTLPMATSWRWSVESGSATINASTGVLTPTKAESTVVVKATYTGDVSVFVTQSIAIPKSVPIITGPTTAPTYDGRAKTPNFDVKFEGKALKKDTDYKVSYQNNVNAGTAKATITGTTVWKGTKEQSFTINKAPLSAANVTVASATYTGSAVKPAPTVKFTDGNGKVQTLKSGTDYSVVYSSNTNITNSGAKATVTGSGNFTGSVTKGFAIKGATITYETHVQNIGWTGNASSRSPVANGAVSGTSGRGLRVEALRISLVNNSGKSGKLHYRTQIQNVGWQEECVIDSKGTSDAYLKGNLRGNDYSGTSGRALRLETLEIRLTGDLAKAYDIYYRVHVQNVGWMGWAKNGENAAGTVGLGLRMEAMQVYLLPAGSTPPGSTMGGATSPAGAPCAIDASAAGRKGAVSYDAMVHIQNQGDTKYSKNNGSTTLGTSGRSLRLEAMTLKLATPPVSGGLSYSVHIQNIGWEKEPATNGTLSGTQGRALRLEALCISLTGEMAKRYDVYYRTHVQNIGWTGWAKNGQSCGSAGYAYRMEAMQIVIVAKGTTAPGLNSSYFYQR